MHTCMHTRTHALQREVESTTAMVVATERAAAERAAADKAAATAVHREVCSASGGSCIL